MGRKPHLSYKKNMERKKRAIRRQSAILQTSRDETTLQSLKSSLELPDGTWSNQSPPYLEKLGAYKISQSPGSSQPVAITHCVGP